MSEQTPGQKRFEAFCRAHALAWKRVPCGQERTPDYEIDFGGHVVYFEIKDITVDDQFTPSSGVRIVGKHVRSQIERAREQILTAARKRCPAVLLIFNAVDPYAQAFGTEDHDFITAMYGEVTMAVNTTTNAVVESFFGKDHLLDKCKNTSFSGVGGFREGGNAIFMYENWFAKNKLPVAALASVFNIRRVEVAGGV